MSLTGTSKHRNQTSPAAIVVKKKKKKKTKYQKNTIYPTKIDSATI
jgi:hypothetical protein